MSCQMTSQSLIKGCFLCVLLIIFMEKQLNSEAKPSMPHLIRRKELSYTADHLQNTSSCTYVVQPIGDPRAEGQLKELFDILCVNVGHSCSTTKTKANQHTSVCMQTYKDIKVNTESNNTITVYTGCVCASDRHPKKLHTSD